MTVLTGATVADLEPGDRMTMPRPVGETDQTAVFVTQTTHPLWPHLQLVLWRMSDGTWSPDALDARQELPGEVHRADTWAERNERLRAALTHGRPS